ncbi:hypothetical protein A5893_09195 [Pedobacter psychrophilus]|uniref:DUF1440 domain-containing protein n=1 Tax=Pedobacter psychrophilus TaxID=1826909 RepID=A0A179DFC0_9SPHI|nr:hypothetical protein [Pedobacter psychrophilus]OAQ39746.1 hypothetical protein A5893_09195 [Pedobacter psychrophilus]
MKNYDSLLYNESYQGSIKECYIIAILATLAMTIFSILMTNVYKKEFREPNLIGKIVEHHIKDSPKWLSITSGYIIHFVVGFIFTSIQLYLYLLIAPVWYNAILLGIINGIVGCIIWYFTIMIYSDVLFVKVGSFLYQLMFAHIIFSIVIMLMYILPRLNQL